MISHAYAVLELGESALLHAEHCLEETLHHDIQDFDLVFAYEAMARAYMVLSNNDKSREYLDIAYQRVDQVVKPEDKTYCISQLDDIKNTIQK